jgi:microprocessor complex subunit DGCR8
MSEPSPYAILVTCLQKNYGLGDTNIETTMTPARNQRNEFKMKVNEREVSEYLLYSLAPR